MTFTAAERRLLGALVILLAGGYLLSAAEWLWGAERRPPGAPAGPAAHDRRAAAVTPPVRERARPVFRDGFLDLNRADSLDLEALPGIGPTLAGRILAYRRRVGGFGSVEQLREVRGIGPARLASLAGRVTVAGRCSLHAHGLRFSQCTSDSAR